MIFPFATRLHAATGFVLTALCAICVVGCGSSSDEPRQVVTLYCSVDEPFAREVVAAFEKTSGIRVQLKIDNEAGKTTGLVRRIEAEHENPVADVFWSSEIFKTILLGEQGMLAEYRPPADGIPEEFKDPDGRWTAFGLRARVIAYNINLVNEEDLPRTWEAIADERWTERIGLADPRFGTTRGHFAAMLALWGEERYKRFLQSMYFSIKGRPLDGNATAARLVGAGSLDLCATDTDDVFVRQDRGDPIRLTYPDMGDGGTLLIPNTVGLIANAPHPEPARTLINFLTSSQVEEMLAKSTSRNIPVRAELREAMDIELPPQSKLSYKQAASEMNRAIELVTKHLLQ